MEWKQSSEDGFSWFIWDCLVSNLLPPASVPVSVLWNGTLTLTSMLCQWRPLTKGGQPHCLMLLFRDAPGLVICLVLEEATEDVSDLGQPCPHTLSPLASQLARHISPENLGASSSLKLKKGVRFPHPLTRQRWEGGWQHLSAHPQGGVLGRDEPAPPTHFLGADI